MSRVPSKHSRDQALNFQGFLNDLQDWELSFKDKDEKLKPQTSQKINYDDFSRMSSNLMAVEDDTSLVDANSEKELGNEYFKQKKYNDAIDCYSRSIALSPTAVAFANRAMAYLKIKRFREAEEDCTEALSLDDRYIKAYSRRATSRKELGKLKESLDDAEFAARLEPHNQEVKKQFSEIKSLFQKAILNKACQVHKRSEDVTVIGNKKDINGNAKGILPSAGTNKNAGISLIPEKEKKPVCSVEQGRKHKADEEKANDPQVDQTCEAANNNSHSKTIGPNRQELSVQELARRAASRATMESAKNISPPSSSYQFEVYWKGFSGDQSLQARLLKVIEPEELPKIFKNSLSAPILIGIIKCIATFFSEETGLGIRYLKNLTKVSRFDILIMCLPSSEKDGLRVLWDEVFLSKVTPIEYAEELGELHPRYCPQK